MTRFSVIFVCVHNAGRSQMAEAFFNHLAAGREHAISAGTQPAAELNPVVVAAMREVGLDISTQRPRLLTRALLENVDMAVTMGCGDAAACPATLIKSEDWALTDPAGQPLEVVRRVRDEIAERVAGLLKSRGLDPEIK